MRSRRAPAPPRAPASSRRSRQLMGLSGRRGREAESVLCLHAWWVPRSAWRARSDCCLLFWHLETSGGAEDPTAPVPRWLSSATHCSQVERDALQATLDEALKRGADQPGGGGSTGSSAGLSAAEAAQNRAGLEAARAQLRRLAEQLRALQELPAERDRLEVELEEARQQLLEAGSERDALQSDLELAQAEAAELREELEELRPVLAEQHALAMSLSASQSELRDMVTSSKQARGGRGVVVYFDLRMHVHADASCFTC